VHVCVCILLCPLDSSTHFYVFALNEVAQMHVLMWVLIYLVHVGLLTT
jgi:hypothetical protein